MNSSFASCYHFSKSDRLEQIYQVLILNASFVTVNLNKYVKLIVTNSIELNVFNQQLYFN